MSHDQIRLELLKLFIPNASRQGLTDPTIIIEVCSKLEKYVVGCEQVENSPDSTTRKGVRPRKEKSDHALPSFLDPVPQDG